MKTYHIASGILRQEDTILMIKQGKTDETPYWFIPGGMIEPGEHIENALKREIQEETGMIATHIGNLAYVVQVISHTHQTIAFVFDVTHFVGILAPDDPDNLIHDIQFMPVHAVIQELDRVAWLSMRQPLMSYLQSQSSAGTIWQYRQHGEFEYELVSRLPAQK